MGFLKSYSHFCYYSIPIPDIIPFPFLSTMYCIYIYVAPVPFKKAVVDRWSEFTSSEKLRVCIGTWNVNGGKHVRSIALKNQSTTDWLLDGPTISGVAKEHVS